MSNPFSNQHALSSKPSKPSKPILVAGIPLREEIRSSVGHSTAGLRREVKGPGSDRAHLVPLENSFRIYEPRIMRDCCHACFLSKLRARLNMSDLVDGLKPPSSMPLFLYHLPCDDIIRSCCPNNLKEEVTRLTVAV